MKTSPAPGTRATRPTSATGRARDTGRAQATGRTRDTGRAKTAGSARAARLTPAHFEPEWVPGAVREYARGLDTLQVGRPGKVGLLELTYEQRGERTELTAHYQKSPLQIMRPLYTDPHRPDLPITMVMSTGGGVVQGDRLRLDVRVGPGASAHLTTQAATKIMKMDHDYATQSAHLRVEDGGYLEYLPDPVIPYVNSRYFQGTDVVLDPSATAILGDTVVAGRLARGEQHEFKIFASDLTVRRPDGTELVCDTIRLRGDHASALVNFGAHTVLGTLIVVTPLRDAATLASVLRKAVAEPSPSTRTGQRGPVTGVSVLPYECGAWLRIGGNSTEEVSRLITTAWDALRWELIDTPAPKLRKT
ncbi:urease accessory protein UreD [Devriesea agamarum]|uniref:urease accessory protein UreD n=1 Tax=Devriesea agamarum TaxID=472569 RepID=UPI000A69D629|nr:urease accessory protein UreD [Devriesea agamarum]